MNPLAAALYGIEKECDEAIDALRALPALEHEDIYLGRIEEHTRKLALAVRLVGYLRRYTSGATVRELHDVFGAPGDFGYETPLGAALNEIYKLRGSQVVL